MVITILGGIVPILSDDPVYQPAPAHHAAIWLSPLGGERLTGHNLLWTLRLTGPSSRDRMTAALEAVIARHGALRAVFRWAQTGLEWRILPPAPVELVQAREPFDSAQFALAPYDLLQGPLYRFALISDGPDDHRLLCGFSHLIIDGTSWTTFARELVAQIAGSAANDAQDLPVCAVKLAQDQATWLQSPAAEHARDRARRDLSGLTSTWQISPVAGSKPDGTDRQGQLCTTDLPGPLAMALRTASTRLGTTPFRLAMAAFAVLVARLARRDDVYLKTTLVGRDLDRARPPVGFFVTQSVLPLWADPTRSFGQFAASVHDAVADAQRHQRLPLREAALAARLPTSVTRQGITDVSFTRRPDPIKVTVGDVTANDDWHETQQLDGALSVQMQCRDQGFRFVWRARADSSFGSVEALSDRYQALLSEALANPEDLAIGDLSGLSLADRALLLGPLNATDVAFPDKAPLHEMVIRQAERSPQKIAVIAGDHTLSYGAILTAAARLAHRLSNLGVGLGQMVPVKMHPSPEMLVSELAIMMTGAAYAPLSPDWPEARVKTLCSRLGSAPALVCGVPNSGEFSVDGLFSAEGPAPRPTVAGGMDDPIYCIFTSGSTGTPKGAVNLHRGIVNRLLAMTHAFGASSQDVTLVTAPSTVDTHVWQFFWPLLHGGTVVIPTRGQAVSPPELVRLIDHHGVTVADFVPSIFADLVGEVTAQKPNFARLRLVLIGGEAIRPADVHAFQAVLPRVVVANSYGPTETSISAIYHIVKPNEAPIPIGRPFANVRAIVMEDRHLAPLGAVGELYLGGACLGSGYLADPEATRESFIPNPFPELGSDRLYRTGDLARMRPDGSFEYLGRADHQIKTRGQRIEPAEVEDALLRQPSVSAAFVFADEAQNLCAKLVAKTGESLDVRKLRAGLMVILPFHMIPTCFSQVSALPLAPGGKIDRRAARDLAAYPLPDARPASKPPQTLTETALAELWAKDLGQYRIGRDDDVFNDLGIDSLQAMRLVLAAEQMTGRDLGLPSLFRHATLAKFAALIDASPAQDSARQSILDRQRDFLRTWSGVQLHPDGLLFTKNADGRLPPLFWCCQGHAELEALGKFLGATRPVIGMRSGHLLMDYTVQNIAYLAQAYAGEMMKLQPEGDFVLGGNCQAAVIARAAADCLQAAGRKVALLILLEETNLTPCTVPTVLLYGKDSHLNPFKATDPMAQIVAAFGSDVRVAFVPGRHGQLFTPGLGTCVAEHLGRVDPLRPEALLKLPL